MGVHTGTCDMLKSAFISMGNPVLLTAHKKGVKGKKPALCCGSRCRILQAHCRHLLSWRENQDL